MSGAATVRLVLAFSLAACQSERLADPNPPPKACDAEADAAIRQYGQPVNDDGDAYGSGRILTFVVDGDTITYTFRASYDNGRWWCGETSIQL